MLTSPATRAEATDIPADLSVLVTNDDGVSAPGIDALVTEALEVMGREDVNQLPVIRDGLLAGIVSRGHILRLLQTRAELQA